MYVSHPSEFAPIEGENYNEFRTRLAEKKIVMGWEEPLFSAQ